MLQLTAAVEATAFACPHSKEPVLCTHLVPSISSAFIRDEKLLLQECILCPPLITPESSHPCDNKVPKYQLR
jgi:hypothetical protein